MVAGEIWLFSVISTGDRTRDAATTRSGSPVRGPELVLATIFVSCGLVGLIVAYLSESAGVMGIALALTLCLFIFSKAARLLEPTASSGKMPS